MLTGEYDILHMLYELPQKFMVDYRAKRWAQAKHSYDVAVTLCVHLRVEQRHREALFGNRAYAADDEEIKDGLFPERLVSNAYLQCIKHNQTRELQEKPRKIT